MGGIGYPIVLIVWPMILAMPIWLPGVMLVWHAFVAKPWWRFSVQFLLALMVAECIALAISVTFYRLLDDFF